ncbi:MAG: APC family permease [Candidatus Dormibacter sp.]
MASAAPAHTERPSPRGRVAGLGPLLCWAVVFADLGTSVYYTPGILFSQFGAHAALFVGLTLIVFVLLTIKYAEVTIRYPEGGGVVTVGTHAVSGWVGLVGGLFILVDYFLTSALSAVSGVTYLGSVAPPVVGIVVVCTVAALVFIAALNLMGISADAKVTAMIASAALLSQLAVIAATIAHAGIGAALGAVPKIFSSHLTGVGLLTGYAGAFLAFSGLESISQLSPAMATPRHKVAPRTMVLVIVTVAITSPLLTLWSTTLLTGAKDPNQFISLLAGYAAGPGLQTEVALTAALLLIFAANTATIGCYHVFLALSRMRFLPEFLQKRNRLRDTPHWAILVATAIPVAVVLATRGSTTVLGDLYAFGLLGAFSVTCISLDIVRWRERRHHGRPVGSGMADVRLHTSTPKFVIGVITSVLVVTAWTTNLFAKPLATLFGVSLTLLGLAIVAATQWRRRQRGRSGWVPHAEKIERLRVAADPQGRSPIIVLLHGSTDDVTALVDVAAQVADGATVIFLYVGSSEHARGIRQLREIVDPYLVDQGAQTDFRDVQARCGRRVRHRLVYAAGDRDWDAAAIHALRHFDDARVVLLGHDAHDIGAPATQTERHSDATGVSVVLWSMAGAGGRDPA